jgi:apolipoprotein N-acyltransferase
MYLYGGMGKPAALGILVLFSFYLGLYHALFAGLLGMSARRGVGFALVAAPFLWVAVELARARITSFPWDQLGMSQIDNQQMVRLAPWTGVYGISFVLTAFCAVVSAWLLVPGWRAATLTGWRRYAVALTLLAMLAFLSIRTTRQRVPSGHEAVMLQPNALEGDDRAWLGDGYAKHIEVFSALSEHPPIVQVEGGQTDLVLWPESPSPLIEQDERFQQAASEVARRTGAALIVGDVSRTRDLDGRNAIYNSANFFTPEGKSAGRYDKVHLVPFGEYIPLANLFSFAKALTAEAGDMTPGRERVMLRTGGHTYGVFICYESIFADEVRLFAKQGADVLVNISDDGWYGATSAPWQHLNMARMRAIENRRWVLGDTNSGQTVSINPRGEIEASAPAHVTIALRVEFGYRTDTTFYTRHGDWFAYAVTILAGAMLAVSQFKGAGGPIATSF